HSRLMAARGIFEHELPGEATFPQRIQGAGLRYGMIGENIYKSVNIAEPVPTAIKGWMNSPGHRKNILTPGYTETGVGVWKTGRTYYFTQDFFRPLEVRPARPLP
ncbi:MAG TPA: CAP domain-containing protein, partial [Armatimonadota bacterium]|nr:CAP domain-containing protein [Armatimonadota bacterium]